MTVFLKNMERTRAKNLTLVKVEYHQLLAHLDQKVAKDLKVQRKKRHKNEKGFNIYIKLL